VLLLRLLLLRIGASARVSAPRPGSRFAEVHPEKLAVVSVAEPRQFYRDRMSAEYNIPPDRMFGEWEDLVQVPRRLADFAIVATQDRDHVSLITTCTPAPGIPCIPCISATFMRPTTAAQGSRAPGTMGPAVAVARGALLVC